MKLSRLLRLTAIGVVVSIALGAPANPLGRLYDQPDGSTTPEIFMKGDQRYNWKTDTNGYTVIQDDRGWWVYAKQTDGDLVSSGVRIGRGNPKKLGLTTNLKIHPSKRQKHGLHDRLDEASKEHRSLINVPARALCNFQGTRNNPCRLKGLVVLVRLSNHVNRVLPSPEEFDILFNSNGPTTNKTAPTGSVSDVFMANSYDSFVLESTVTPWIPVSRSEKDTVDNYWGLNMPGTKATWKQALEMVETRTNIKFTDFDQDGDDIFDCLVMMHSGSAAETGGTDCETGQGDAGRIWSHQTADTWFRSSTTGVRNYSFYVASAVWAVCPPGGKGTKWDIARIAVIAHECSHFLGLPDLYDTDVGSGQGSFELLANMWGWYGTQYYPPLMSAWCKMHLGWVDVVTITASGTYTLRQACTSNVVFKIDHNMPHSKEYFLIENRFACGFDIELKHHSGDRLLDRDGAAVWHIDESGANANNHVSEGHPEDGGKFPKKHYTVALQQADGHYHLEKGENRGDNRDLFRMEPGNPDCAYMIDQNGITLNNGQRKPFPNTKPYSSFGSNGEQLNSDISIEFGPAGPTMWMKVTLGGAPPPTPPPPTPPPPTNVEIQSRNTDITSTNIDTAEKNRVCNSKPSGVCFKIGGTYYLKACNSAFIKRNRGQVCRLNDEKRNKPIQSICRQTC